MRLEANGTEVGCLLDAVPVRHGDGRFPARGANWGECKWDALEDAKIAFHLSLHGAGGRLHDRAVVLSRWS
jgi:hypothetical protein